MIRNDEISNSLIRLQGLPLSAIYLCGVVEKKTGLSNAVISRFLRTIYENSEVSDEEMKWVEERLSEGMIGEVHEYLKGKRPCEDIESLIWKMKNSEKYHKKCQVPLERSCFCCGDFTSRHETYVLNDCKHCFHKNCLISEIEYLLEKDVSIIKCPFCAVEIQISDLKVFLPPTLMQKYDSINYLNLSRIRQRVQCENVKCGEIFDLQKNQKNCENCGVGLQIKMF